MTRPHDPLEVYRSLRDGHPLRLGELPREHGIYALHDHKGAIRYIGITPGDPLGFYGRIHNRHAAGSEIRSHKFSHAYNTGRMYRAKKDARPDALLAKGLRAAFARRYCRATIVVVPPALLSQLRGMEKAVQALAPAGTLNWGDQRGFSAVAEPRGLVDELLDEMRFTPEQRQAIERQAILHGAA